ncbi:tripartite tricarboxylate transporter permease [Marinovum sp. F03]|uniref:tripartite tricarboxylate transporter permease n=1 Tax=Marinovum sp. F03 TaxID=3449226 RepID=UPI003EDC9A0E
MDLLANLSLGLATAATAQNLMYCFVGVFLGTFIGVLPGVGPLAAVAMLLPVSFYLPPETALVMLAGVYYGAEYGGSIASILLNIPGTPSASVTCLDGYPMAQQGRAGVALFATAMASMFGALFGVVVMVLLSPKLAEFALLFQPAEYFSVMVLGLVAASIVNSTGAVRGLMMVCLGILLGTVGVDVNSGETRFTGGFQELRDGVSLVVVAMGLFGISEVMVSLRGATKSYAGAGLTGSMLPTAREWLRSLMPALRGSAVGSFFGTLPGTGQTVASFVGYALEKRVNKRGASFGTGAIEGVVVPESANNAAAQTAFIPTLTLGIPGSTTMALMLGALMIHGITPGPRLISEHPELFWGLVVSFVFGNIFLLILNIPLIGLWVRDPAGAASLPLSDGDRADLCRRLQHLEFAHRCLDDAALRVDRLCAAAVPLRAGSDVDRLRAGPDDGGIFPPRHALVAWRSERVPDPAGQCPAAWGGSPVAGCHRAAVAVLAGFGPAGGAAPRLSAPHRGFAIDNRAEVRAISGTARPRGPRWRNPEFW